MPFQPNLLTDFTLLGPYNIVLFARHPDTLIQVPHLEVQPFLHTEDKLNFPIESPYKKVHDEVKSLMPLAPLVGTLTDSGENLTDDDLPKVLAIA